MWTISEKSLDYKTLTGMGGTCCGHLGSAKCDSFKYQTANESPHRPRAPALCREPRWSIHVAGVGLAAAFPSRQMCSHPLSATGVSGPSLISDAKWHLTCNQVGESRESASQLIQVRL